MNLKRIILFFTFFASVVCFAQSRGAEKPAVFIDNISFKQVSKNDISGAGGPLLRCEITLLVKSVPEKKGSNPNWARNLEIGLTAGFEDKQNKSGGWLLLESKAKIFAAERNKKTSVVFYIPWESYSIYRITKDPDFYEVSLTVDSVEIPIDEKNVKDRVSKTIKSMKDLEAFRKAVESDSSRNKSVLKPLNECATNVQYYEFTNSRIIHPTYLDAR